ncbi:MAG: hypothetical protein K2O01_04690 [Bacteroidales bacterium]|nr:hypothetical protein [Bacteroidales bacterium]
MKRYDMDKKLAALFGALWIGLWLCGGAVRAQAFKLPEFTSEFDLKSEATLKIGPAFPMGDFKRQTGTSGIPQGAAVGFSADLSYQYYFVPYFGLGVAVGAQLFGYDFNTAITTTYPGKLHKTGWEVYSAGLSLNVRVPIISKLYLIGQVQGRCGFMISPMASAVEKIPVLDAVGKKLRTDRQVTKVIRARDNLDMQIGADFGLQYRIVKHLLAQLTVEYRYGVFGNSHKNTETPLGEMQELAFRYSALAIHLGVTYAFGKKDSDR